RGARVLLAGVGGVVARVEGVRGHFLERSRLDDRGRGREARVEGGGLLLWAGRQERDRAEDGEGESGTARRNGHRCGSPARSTATGRDRYAITDQAAEGRRQHEGMPLDETTRRLASALQRDLDRLAEQDRTRSTRGEEVRVDSVSRMATAESR